MCEPGTFISKVLSLSVQNHSLPSLSEGPFLLLGSGSFPQRSCLPYKERLGESQVFASSSYHIFLPWFLLDYHSDKTKMLVFVKFCTRPPYWARFLTIKAFPPAPSSEHMCEYFFCPVILTAALTPFNAKTFKNSPWRLLLPSCFNGAASALHLWGRPWLLAHDEIYCVKEIAPMLRVTE